MPKKEEQIFPLADDVGHDFERQDFILNFKPKIEFVEPEQIEVDGDVSQEEPDPGIEDFRNRTQDLIKGYDAVKKLADVAEKRIDNRVAAAGGLTMKLDAQQDAPVIAAMKRVFPDKLDSTSITYDDYKKCLKDLKKMAPPVPAVTSDDIRAAKQNPLQTNFGGSDNTQGENRAELSSPGKSIIPIDLAAFQAAAVISLFGMMLPLISLQDDIRIARHLLETPHKPI